MQKCAEGSAQMLISKTSAHRTYLFAFWLVTLFSLFVNKANAAQETSPSANAEKSPQKVTSTTLGTLPSTLKGDVIDITPVIKKDNAYYITTKQGDIFYANFSDTNQTSNSTTGEATESKSNTSTIKQIFSLKQRIPEAISLDALALHPSFFLRDQQGENTLYTSHLEPAEKLGRALIERGEDVILDDIKLHSVITEWRLDSIGEVDLTSPREVIRIALPAGSKGVEQLAFSANLQAWQEGYGLMYLSLNPVERWQNTPLYSGAILRINPQKFGLKNYTSPTDNPFTKQTKHPHELWAYALGKINRFAWLARQKNALAIDRTLLPSQERQIGKVTMGVKDSNAVKPLVQWPVNPNAETYIGGHDQLLNYRGKSLPNITNSLVYLQINEADSASVLVKALDIYTTSNNANKTIWQFDAPQPPMLTTNNNNDLLVYQRTTKQLMMFASVENRAEQSPEEVALPSSGSSNTEQTQAGNSSSSNLLLTSVLIVFVTAAAFYAFKRFSNRKLSTRQFLEQQFVKVKFESSLQQLLLYKYHQESIEKKVNCKELSSIELRVNEDSCFVIHRESGLTNQIAKESHKLLSNATQTSLGTDDLRTIVLLLNLISGEQLSVYVYVRKSKHRLTRVTYEQCQDDVLNLCWQLSAIIAPATTEVQDKPRKTSSSIKKPIAAPSPQSTAAANSPSKTENNDRQAQHADTETQNTPETNSEVHKDEQTRTSERDRSLDIEVVNALEKLVKLKQQNFLSDEEFEQAKAKLLKDL